jgi:hypothetical protein
MGMDRYHRALLGIFFAMALTWMFLMASDTDEKPTAITGMVAAGIEQMGFDRVREEVRVE